MKVDLFRKKTNCYVITLSYIILNFIFFYWGESLDKNVHNKITLEYSLYLIFFISFSIIVAILLYYANTIITIIIGILNSSYIPTIILMTNYNFRLTSNNHVYILTRATILIVRIFILFWSIYRLYKLNKVKKVI